MRSTDQARRTMAISFFALVIVVFSHAAHAQDWVITKPQWLAQDEINYSNWIAALGESGCRTVDDCIKSPANPYRNTDGRGLKWTSDCGRFPYLLRAYFASKNGLPMSVVSAVAPVDGLGKDLRYSPKGNYATARMDAIQKKSGREMNAYETIYKMVWAVFTATYRHNAELDQPNGNFFDFVPVSIDRNNVRPGTVIYDANGHVAVVYKVTNTGVIRFMDAHPDNSVTRSIYGEKFSRSSAFSGGGFKNFRPLYLAGAKADRRGALIGGRVVTWPMNQIPGFSMEQYFGTNPSPDRDHKKASFVVNGQKLGWYDFVRTRLSGSNFHLDPVNEMVEMMDAICGDIKDRKIAVESSITKGIHRKAHPYQLPTNIFGASGEWEEEATPSRDARLKTSFVEIRNKVQEMVDLYRQGSPRIDYRGTNLVADLRAAYEQKAASCSINYVKSDGSAKKLTYNDVQDRAFAISFDPYHCPELRWGASETSELVTCRDDSTKRAWYDAEQRLRNQIERTYDARMDYTLDQLRQNPPGLGAATPPDANLRRYLNSL